MRQNIHNLIHNLPLLISAAALAALNATSMARVMAGVVFLCILFLCSARMRFSFEDVREGAPRSVLTVSVLAALYFSICFFDLMVRSSMIKKIAGLVGISNRVIVGACAVAGGLVSVYALMFLITWLLRIFCVKTRPGKSCVAGRDGLAKIELLVCFLTAAITMTLLSKSSPLYPFNDWEDANCFLTMGRAMLHGMVPYRDLYEQKGPLLYMVHAMAAVVSEQSFFGVYLLEIIASFGFLAVCRKILNLYREDSSLLWIPVIATVVYSAPAFCHGDSVEELCLPLLAYCLYVGLRSVARKTEVSVWEGFWIGVTSACVLWSKFTLLGIYIGWFAAYGILCIRERAVSAVFRLLGAIALGVAALSAPVLMYFIFPGGLRDLFGVYFYNNLFVYSDAGEGSAVLGLLRNLYLGSLNFSRFNLPACLLTVVSLLGMISAGKNRELLLLGLSAFGAFFFAYVGGSGHVYYSFMMCVFVPAGILAVTFWEEELRKHAWVKRYQKSAAVAVAVLCLTAAFFGSDNTYLLGTPKTDMPQTQFAGIIRQKEQPTLLNYGFLDGGYYTTANILPTCRFFCYLNIPLAELQQTHERYIAEGLVDFIVTRDVPLQADKYQCVAQASFFYEDAFHTDYLYQLILEET